jgi:outer membrane protein OmpU
MDAVGLTAFMTDDSELGGVEAYGVGASYDLGGGATLAGGVAKDKTNDSTLYDLGVTFSF